MDWVDLFVGSEGTLGVVTEARVRLLPGARRGRWPAWSSSPTTTPPSMPSKPGAPTARPRMLEYFDAPSLDLLRARFPEIPAAAARRHPVRSGTGRRRRSRSSTAGWSASKPRGALAEDSWFALTAADRERFRHFRHSLPELVNDTVRRSGALKMNTDYAVPLARNREMLAYYRRRLEEEFPGRYVIFGHIGDAHVHVNIFSDPPNPAHAGGLLLEFARQAVALGGTVSAEHGLGKRKAHLLELQYSAEHLDAMRAVKRRLDPQNLLGRGTLFV